MFNFKKHIGCLLISFILLSNIFVSAFKPIPQNIDKNPFNRLYNEFISVLKDKGSNINVEKFFVHYIKRCPCSDDSIEQIILIIDALYEANINFLLFESLLLQEQAYNNITKIHDNNLRLREFINFMETDRFRFNKWHINLLFSSRLPKLIVDEENHNIMFKVKLKDWGNNIYITFSLKPIIDTSIGENYAKI